MNPSISPELNIEDSERLSFTLHTQYDADLLFELDQDEVVMRYINGGSMTTMASIQQDFIPRMQSYTNCLEGWGLWKVTRKQDNAYLGWLLVRPMSFFTETPKFDDLELGWRFKRATWGQGYGTEAAKHVMNALSKQTGINCFSAIAHEENKASIKIMQKLGMEFVSKAPYTAAVGEIQVVHYQIKLN